MAYKVEMVRKYGKRWFWRLKSNNGKTLAHSETYTNKSGASKIATKLAKDLKCKLEEITSYT